MAQLLVDRGRVADQPDPPAGEVTRAFRREPREAGLDRHVARLPLRRTSGRASASHLVVLADDAEPHRAALVLRLQLALVDLQLRDEVLERDLVGIAARLPRAGVLGVHALVVVRLGLLRERREIRIGARGLRVLLVRALLELDAATGDGSGCPSSSNSSSPGSGATLSRRARVHDVEAVREPVELDGPTRLERAIDVAVDDVGFRRPPRPAVDLRDQPAMRQVEAEAVAIASDPRPEARRIRVFTIDALPSVGTIAARTIARGSISAEPLASLP